MADGGEQALIQAAESKPDVILFDESTSALDPKASSRIEELVVELKNTVTIIQVTHSAENATYGSRIIRLADGLMVT